MSWLDRLLVRFILRWRPPQSVGSFSLEDPSNNYAFVTMSSDSASFKGERVQVVHIENETIGGRAGSGSAVHDVEIPLSEVSNPAYHVMLHKKGWNISYSSLMEAAFDLAGAFYVRRFLQAIYDRRLRVYDDRIGILKAVMTIKKERLLTDEESFAEIVSGDSPIGRTAVLQRIYGAKIVSSPMYYQYLKLLSFHIDAWIESGELRTPGDGSEKMIVTPKTIISLATHELDMQKHRDTLRPAKIAAFAALLAVMVAFAQLYLALAEEEEEPTSIEQDTAN